MDFNLWFKSIPSVYRKKSIEFINEETWDGTTHLLLFSSMFSNIICSMQQVGIYVWQPASGSWSLSANPLRNPNHRWKTSLCQSKIKVPFPKASWGMTNTMKSSNWSKKLRCCTATLVAAWLSPHTNTYTNTLIWFCFVHSINALR